MSTPQDRIAVPGSERAPLHGAHAAGTPNLDERIEVTVLLRSRAEETGGTGAAPNAGMAAQPGQQPRRLSRDEFARIRGADPADVARVEAFAHEHDLDVVEVSLPRRTVVLSGSVAALSAAFGVELARYEYEGGAYRGRSGPVHVPAELASIVQGVFGLDDRPQAQPHIRAQAAGQTSYTPVQLAGLYDFPVEFDGAGECIAIVELGGGYRRKDLQTYFARLNLPVPQITAISVDHGHNRPVGDPTSADGEVLLDIEVAGALAPKARLAVYFAPNTDQGFLDAITTAIHDTVRQPSVVSISWGGPESSWTAQALQAFDQAFQDAATLGVTVCCAAGDGGSSDGATDGLAHVDFPASSLHALACGGTSLRSANGAISGEVVWNDGAGGGATGGGVSDVFALPSWQAGANVPPSANPGGHVGRGVPDVAGDADPATGYTVEVDGQQRVFGGTSAVAPLWAGLIARINQRRGQSVGYLNPVLYGLSPSDGGFHDITEGDNGAYEAGPGWDACTGLGSPDGAALAALLTGAPAPAVAAGAMVR